MTTANHHSGAAKFAIAGAMLLATVLPASAQVRALDALSGGRSRGTRSSAPAQPGASAQATRAASPVIDVPWDGYTFRFLNGTPKQIFPGNSVKPGLSPIAVFSGDIIRVMPGATVNGAPVDVAVLEKSFTDYKAMSARGGGPGVPQTLATVSQGAGGVASIPTGNNGVDQVDWTNGEPRVHLSDGYDVTFSGGNGSKITVVNPENTQTITMQFTEAAHSTGGIARGLGKAVFTGLTTVPNTAALMGGHGKPRF